MIKELILGSGSPRRKELLKSAGFSFTVISPDVDETEPEGMDVHQVPIHLAEEKNKAIRERVADPELVVLTADTVVILDGKIIGKPLDAADACRMLGLLQGRMHEVVTGVCISGGNRREFFSDTTRVYFNSLSREEISYYVDHFQPFDKAGSYAIQEWIGYVGVARIEGCFYNVMGLPIPRVYPLLRDWQP